LLFSVSVSVTVVLVLSVVGTAGADTVAALYPIIRRRYNTTHSNGSRSDVGAVVWEIVGNGTITVVRGTVRGLDAGVAVCIVETGWDGMAGGGTADGLCCV
jgi:hypothetical protein